jgi:hypothetical protein
VVATEQLLINCYLLLRHVQINRGRHGVGLTPQQFLERFSMWQLVTEARDAKQQAALVRSLKILLKSMQLLPQTVQAKAAALKQQLLQQLGVDPEQTQQLISRHPKECSHVHVQHIHWRTRRQSRVSC